GDGHRRQRRVMLPAFGAAEAKVLLPVFQGCAERLSIKWREVLTESPDEACVLNIPKWISAATLDAIGEAAFGYKFGALEDSDNELAGAYFNFLYVDSPSLSKAYYRPKTGRMSSRRLHGARSFSRASHIMFQCGYKRCYTIYCPGRAWRKLA
ncbi:hypothetical protein CERSUDRAFT_57694, partial [Gelatoporia subvermispora B]